MATERVGNTTINVTGLNKYRKDVHRALSSTSPGPLRDAMKKWAVRYRAAMQERFDKFSRGGGDWPALKASTIRRRRKGRGSRKRAGAGKVSILRDTGTLFNALDPVFKRLPGQYEAMIPFGILVGFGGSAIHKAQSAQKKRTLTVAYLAEIHHKGLGVVPERKLLVDPSTRLQKAMAGDLTKALERMINKSQVPPAGV